MRWSFEQDTTGRSVIKHQATPRFSAYWTSGKEELPALLVSCWTQPGSGDGEDSLHLFGFRWIDDSPNLTAFDSLMQEAATAIDAWIASRL